MLISVLNLFTLLPAFLLVITKNISDPSLDPKPSFNVHATYNSNF